ncbi:MAG: prepilin-type N-terminal cleavage/methylation domain-containing protein [Actinomycetales bacterium]|nr:prepilin-type N-terminal cleavage/methylation domain-containing protein [Actinomycetales bacterium]
MQPARDDLGFTLVELLVTVVIIGILSVIAIPTFLSQREKANERVAMQDLRNTAVAIEGWSSTTGNVLSDLNGADETSPLLGSEGLRLGEWTRLDITVVASTYCIRGSHDKVPNRELRFRSNEGRVEVGALGSLPC